MVNSNDFNDDVDRPEYAETFDAVIGGAILAGLGVLIYNQHKLLSKLGELLDEARKSRQEEMKRLEGEVEGIAIDIDDDED